MATFYIAPDGDDDNDGSEASPWLNLEHAINNSGSSDIILVGAGTTIQTQGFDNISMNNRTIKSASGSRLGTTIDFDGNLFSRFRSESGATISDLTIIKTNVDSINRGTFNGYDGQINDCKFADCITSRSDSSAAARVGFICNGNGTSVNRCIFENIVGSSSNGDACGLFAIRGDGSYQMDFNNCLIYGDGTAPANTDVPDFIFTLRADNNTTSAIMNVKNCIVYYPNGLRQVYAQNGYEYIQNSPDKDLQLNTKTSCLFNVDYTGSEAGVITTDPLFVDALNGDFRLRPASPCIGTGSLT